MTLQKPAGMRSFAGGYLFRCTRDHDFAAGVAAFGAKVDDVAGGFDHVHVMLDGEDRVSGVDQAMQAIEQALDIREMEAGGRLIEDVESMLRPLQLAQFGGQLDALRFTAR